MTLDAYLKRNQYVSGERPFVYYAIFGFSGDLSIHKTEYRITEIPAGLNFNEISIKDQPDYFRRFFDGAIGAILKNKDPRWAQTVYSSERCLLISGDIQDDQNLLYLQNLAGIIQNFLEDDAVAILDVLTLSWYKPEEWNVLFFGMDKFSPFPHIQIFQSQANDDKIYALNTRGMRKFGRSDIQIKNIPEDQLHLASGLLNHLVAMQADGVIVPDQTIVDVQEFPEKMIMMNRGGYDDLEFNNYYIEIIWKK